VRRATITLADGLDEKVERFRMTQPARPSLTSVVAAALESYLETGGARTVQSTVLNRVLRHRAEIRRIVSNHGGSNPFLFGSVARGEARGDSDIDLLIDLGQGRTLFDLAAMRAELEDLLGVRIDVVATSGLEGDVRDEVLAEALAL
jgi:predicted nucleotidyltransferase